MADPVTMAGVSMGATALGSMVTAYGQQQAGAAQAQMYQYQAGVAQMNQQIANQNASYATYAGEVEAQTSGMKTAAQISETKAIQGASGLDVSSGSALAIRGSELAIGQQDEAMIRSDAAKRAYGYEVESVQAGAQSDLDKMAAAKSQTAGDLSALGSLLGGASSVASKFSGAKTAGIFGGGGAATS